MQIHVSPSTGGRLRCWVAHRRCALGGPLNTRTGIANRSITPAGTHFTHRTACLKFGLRMRGPRPATNQAPRIRGFLPPTGLACDLRWAHGHAHSPRPRSQAKWAIKFIQQGITTSRHTGNSHATLAYCMGTWHARTFSQVTAARRYVLEGLQQHCQ